MAPVIAPEESAVSVQPLVAETAADKDCRTYRDYIAETAREEASAADLNSGMLAESRGGGTVCETEKPSTAVNQPRH